MLCSVHLALSALRITKHMVQTAGVYVLNVEHLIMHNHLCVWTVYWLYWELLTTNPSLVWTMITSQQFNVNEPIYSLGILHSVWCFWKPGGHDRTKTFKNSKLFLIFSITIHSMLLQPHHKCYIISVNHLYSYMTLRQHLLCRIRQLIHTENVKGKQIYKSCTKVFIMVLKIHISW